MDGTHYENIPLKVKYILERNHTQAYLTEDEARRVKSAFFYSDDAYHHSDGPSSRHHYPVEAIQT